MDSPHSRRQFLTIAAGIGVPTLHDGSRVTSEEEAIEYPHSRIIASDALAPFERDETDDGVVISAKTGETLLRRAWDTKAEKTVGTTQFDVDADGTQVRPADGEDTISMIYRHDADRPLYLFDLPTSNALRSRVRDGIDDHERVEGRFEREFGSSGVEITYETVKDATLSIELPYSLCAGRSGGGSEGLRSILPDPGDNGYERYVHAGLVTGLWRLVDETVPQSKQNYGIAATVADFVQSIPHATDWESKRQLNYIRSPEEALLELTADCKDASLFLYDLLKAFDYDPVLAFLVGMKEPVLSDGNKYPNHLAVAVPQRKIEPIPDDVDADVESVEHEGTPYVYIESTSRQPPGTLPEPHRDKSLLFYEDTTDLPATLLKSL